MNTASTVNLADCDAQTIRDRVRAAGVTGAGGAGFPTYVKLQAQVDTFLVNAAECEPMLKVDQQLMALQASRLIRGMQTWCEGGFTVNTVNRVARQRPRWKSAQSAGGAAYANPLQKRTTTNAHITSCY